MERERNKGRLCQREGEEKEARGVREARMEQKTW